LDAEAKSFGFGFGFTDPNAVVGFVDFIGDAFFPGDLLGDTPGGGFLPNVLLGGALPNLVSSEGVFLPVGSFLPLDAASFAGFISFGLVGILAVFFLCVIGFGGGFLMPVDFAGFDNSFAFASAAFTIRLDRRNTPVAVAFAAFFLGAMGLLICNSEC
jgi:hypothetical protein